MHLSQIGDGLWRWTALHPEWTTEADWDAEVACFYYEGTEGVCLIDPLVPADEAERFWTGLDADAERLGLPVAVILTAWYHERSAQVVRDRYGASIWAFEPVAGRLACDVTNTFQAGYPLPGGIEALHGDAIEEVLLWLPDHRALVSGDLLLGEESGVRICPDSWLPDGSSPTILRENLRRAVELPIERILVGHGPAVLSNGREALLRALDHAPSAS